MTDNPTTSSRPAGSPTGRQLALGVTQRLTLCVLS